MRNGTLVRSLLVVCLIAPAPVSAQSPVESGPLKRSDVLFSPRFYHRDWLEAFRAFGANRVVWTYAGPQLVQEAAPLHIPVQCTFPFWVPTASPQGEDMTCTDPQGTAVEDAPTLIYPDINSEAWRQYQLGEVRKLIDAGCTSFQQDVPSLNLHLSTARNGCYSKDSVEKFRAYIETEIAPAQAERLGIGDIDTFDPRAGLPQSAQAAFEDFQRQATAEYHQWLHESAEAYVKLRDPAADPTFSANVGATWIAKGRSDWLLHYFDFFLAEAVGTRETMPKVLSELAQALGELPGVDGITVPSDDVWLHQRSIASAYALGLTTIAPWDVFTGYSKARFFGNPSDFAPLIAVVRANPALFDDYAPDIDHYGSYGSIVPGQGSVTMVDRAKYPGRTTVSWSRAADFQEVPLGRPIVVGGNAYKTIVPSHVGQIYLPPDAQVSIGDPVYFSEGFDRYLVTVAKNVEDAKKKAVHVVSWYDRPVVLSLHLKRNDFAVRPTMLVTSSQPVPTPASPQQSGDYYIYPVGNVLWAILY